MTVCFAYDNESMQDGAGAQALRIIAIYSLARHYKVGYVNHEILSIDSNPGDNLIDSESKMNFIKALNEFLNLSSYSCTAKSHTKKPLPYYRLFRFLPFFQIWLTFRSFLALFRSQHNLYVVQNPYFLIKHKSNIYQHFIDTRPKLKNHRTKTEFNIQMHIPKAKVSSKQLSDRFLPTEWYLQILLPVIKVLREQGVAYKITVHTDVSKPGAIWNVNDGVSEKTRNYLKENRLLDQNNSIALNYEDFTSTLSQLGDIQIATGISPLVAWEMMLNADLLLIGKSTFSFVPALMNSNGTVISPRFYPKGPDTWLTLDKPSDLTDRIASEIVAQVSLV